VGDLEGPQHALGEEFMRFAASNIVPFQQDSTGGGWIYPCDDVEQRRLASAVRTDEAGDGAFFNS